VKNGRHTSGLIAIAKLSKSWCMSVRSKMPF
jgi:hypothetical protein